MNQSESFHEKFVFLVWSIKICSLSYLTPYKKKKQIRDKIEEKARCLAIKNGLIISFYSLLLPLPYRMLACIDPQKTKIERHIYFGINSRYIRANENTLLITFFHEYCHFLLDYKDDKLLFRFIKLRNKGKIPNFSNDIFENFCDVFGIYIVDGTTHDTDIDDFIKYFIEITTRKIDDEKWMYKISM